MLIERIITGKNRAFHAVQVLTVQRQRELTTTRRVSDRTRAKLTEAQRIYDQWLVELAAYRATRRAWLDLEIEQAAKATPTPWVVRPPLEVGQGEFRVWRG